jgi:hypothetical protein
VEEAPTRRRSAKAAPETVPEAPTAEPETVEAPKRRGRAAKPAAEAAPEASAEAPKPKRSRKPKEES